MDLKIAGKKALVCGCSAGLGFACAEALARKGVDMVIAARTPETLAQAAIKLKAIATAGVACVAADVTTDEGRARIFNLHPDFDIVITNAGGPPPGDFRDWDRDAWLRALDANMLSPIAIINITSSAVKSPVDGLGLSTGARSGLTGFVAGLARTTVAKGVTINNILPGTFDTARLAGNFAAAARRGGLDAAQVRADRIAKHPAKRLGQPEEFGAACAFLCSAHAGYINGQNLLMDGGSFSGVF